MTSTVIISVQQNLPVAAVQAVPDSYELLEMIILCLDHPVMNIVRGVAKSWGAVVKHSRSIREARCLEIREWNDVFPGYSSRDKYIHISYYELDYDLRDAVQPLNIYGTGLELVDTRLDRVRALEAFPSRTSVIYSYQQDWGDNSSLDSFFATNPPLQSLGLTIEGVRRNCDPYMVSRWERVWCTENTCVVYNEVGVTIGDLRAVEDALWETYTNCVLRVSINSSISTLECWCHMRFGGLTDHH